MPSFRGGIRQPPQVAGLAVEMHRDDGCGLPVCAAARVVGIDQKSPWIHVREARRAAGGHNRLRSEGRSEDGRDHFSTSAARRPPPAGTTPTPPCRNRRRPRTKLPSTRANSRSNAATSSPRMKCPLRNNRSRFACHCGCRGLQLRPQAGHGDVHAVRWALPANAGTTTKAA